MTEKEPTLMVLLVLSGDGNGGGAQHDGWRVVVDASVTERGSWKVGSEGGSPKDTFSDALYASEMQQMLTAPSTIYCFTPSPSQNVPLTY